MKRALIFILAAGIGFAAASWMVSKRDAVKMAEQQTLWQAEKSRLETALEQALERARLASAGTPLEAPQKIVVPVKLTPAEIIERLQKIRGTPGANTARDFRQALYWFEELARRGPAALPAIRDFLARYEDLELDTTAFNPAKGGRALRVPMDFLVPPSLRFGLFDVLRQIGGVEAGKILAESLARTGRGVEVAYLARALQEIAPDQYREQVLLAARSLLANIAPMNSASPLDRNHRYYLFDVLAFYGDKGFSQEAQAQLIGADSQIDRAALLYLQQSLGSQAVPLAMQVYQNSALTNSANKEPLARLALSYVGVDAQANQFYQKAINDPVLTKDHRRNLIEDLNQDGFPDPKKLTELDLPLVQNRIALIEQLAPNAMDDINTAAFKEAYKDLINMRERIQRPPAPVPGK